MQDRLAYITNNQEDIDIFKQQSEIYTNYTINVDSEDILIIYVVINGLALLSCLYVFISISKIRPRSIVDKIVYLILKTLGLIRMTLKWLKLYLKSISHFLFSISYYQHCVFYTA